MGALKKIIYNCKQATFLIEKKLIDRLTMRENIELRIHLTSCAVCRLYGKQSRKINQMVHQLFHSTAKPDIKLDDSFKVELQQRIEQELNKN